MYAQSRLTPYDLKDCNFPRSSIHEIFQAVSYKYLIQDVLKNVYILSVIHFFFFLTVVKGGRGVKDEEHM